MIFILFCYLIGTINKKFERKINEAVSGIFVENGQYLVLFVELGA